MLADELITAKKYPAASAVNCVSLDQPGYYAIHVKNSDSLSNHFDGILRSRNTQLIYIGIATVSLRKRLIEEDLQHRRPSSFFRSLGAILGYRPPEGSLVGRRNQNNYQFIAADTQEIIEWINKHLLVSWVKSSHADKRDECAAIEKLRPLLNLSQNPDALPELMQLREECRRVARSPILTKDTMDMTFQEYYGDPFRNDINDVVAARPIPDRHIKESSDVVLQPVSLSKNPVIGSWNTEQKELFAVALFFTTLVDQVFYTHFQGEYSEFRNLTRYPKYKGDCPGGCNTNLHPLSILRVMGIEKSVSTAVMDEALPVMKNEVLDFFQQYMKFVDGDEFWEKCLAELPGESR